MTLGIHFDKHNKWDFNCQDKAEYQQQAIQFLESDLTQSDSEECVDSDGDIIRYNRVTQEFAIVQAPGIIRTYFKPMPISYAPSGWPPDKTHPFATNRDYFEENCK